MEKNEGTNNSLMKDNFEQEGLLNKGEAISEEIETDEEGTSLRVFENKNFSKSLAIFAVFMSLYHIYTLVFTLSNPLATLSAHWGFGMILIFFFYPAGKKSRLDKISILDGTFVLAVVAVVAYVLKDADGMITRSAYFKPVTLDIVFGIIAIIITLEGARRTIGLGLPVISLLLVAYALWGNYLPGKFSGNAVSPTRLISFLFSQEGIFGTPIKMSMEMILPLTLFGSFLTVNGTGEMFMDLAISGFGHRRGGPAKVAVISSALFGSVSGSAMANVVGTGTFTIPLMKKNGYSSEFAGAVEAVSSTGGQIMPPIMGSGAFIMSELLGVSYSSIALAALLPALLYYFTVYLAVDLEAAKKDLVGVDTDGYDRPGKIMRDGWYLLLPLVALVLTLAVFRQSVIRAAMIGIVTSIACGLLNSKNRMKFMDIIKSLEMGAMRSMSIIAVCACAGIAIGAIMASGLGLKFTILVTQLAGNSLFLALLLSGLAATVLGMGLPTVAAYIISAAVLAGALTTMGIPVLAAHFFLFYYCLLSQITPPVAMAAYAASNIAKANPHKIGFMACRIGIMLFILPFAIVYGPSMVLIGTWQEILFAAITGFIGVYCFTAGQFGWISNGPLKPINRILLVLGSLGMIFSGPKSDLIGFIFVVIGLVTTTQVRNKFLKLKSSL